MKTKKSIAFFDFDGTLTTKDSFIELLKFSTSKFKFYASFLLLSPLLILIKLKLIEGGNGKKIVANFFFKSYGEKEFDELCRSFAKNKIPEFLKQDGLAKIKEHQNNENQIVLVSASFENYLKYWTNKIDIELIGTKFDVGQANEPIKFLGKNCNGLEKVNRITAKYELKQYETIFAYGDTSGDKEMLEIADKSFYRPFKS